MEKKQSTIENQSKSEKTSETKPQLNIKLIGGIVGVLVIAVAIALVAILGGTNGSDNVDPDTSENGGSSNGGSSNGGSSNGGSSNGGSSNNGGSTNTTTTHIHNMVNSSCTVCGAEYSKCLEFTSLGNGECSVSYSSYDPVTDKELEHASDLIIPPTSPSGDKVTVIAQNGFSYISNLVSVTLPNTVKKINNSAFAQNADLKTLVMQEGVISIGERVFSKCTSLTSVNIPSTVTSIDKLTFFESSAMAEINVVEGNTKYKSIDGNLYTKDGKTLLAYASGKQTTAFVVPDGVTKIVENAANHSEKLASVTIPASVEVIERGAFYRCKAITEFKVNSANSNYKDVDGNLYTKDGSVLVQYAIGKSDETFVVPNGVREIMAYSFFYAPNLKRVVISEGVTSVGQGAFYANSSLTEVVFPKTLTKLYTGAFQSCAKITDVYYAGSEAQWALIDLGMNNSKIREATVHYNYVPEN